jgi:heterodisulfide reductase subunit C
MPKVNPGLVEAVTTSEEFDAAACMNCGVCGALCPMEIDILPRRIFRYALLGLEERVLDNTASIYSCLLCRMCEANCPAEVHIAQNVRFLRQYINQNVFRL